MKKPINKTMAKALANIKDPARQKQAENLMVKMQHAQRMKQSQTVHQHQNKDKARERDKGFEMGL